MELYEKLGIKKILLKDLIAVFSRFENVKNAIIFGSRAKGNYKYNSDIDLCIFGEQLSSREFNRIKGEIDELHTAISFDVLLFHKIENEKLQQNITKDGIEIYVSRENA